MENNKLGSNEKFGHQIKTLNIEEVIRNWVKKEELEGKMGWRFGGRSGRLD